MNSQWRESLGEGLGWVVFLDVFGFREMLRPLDYTEIQRRLVTCHQQMADLPGWASDSPAMYIFSDSMFLLYLVSSLERKLDALRRCKEDVEEILGIFAEGGLPLRGGVSFGTVAFGPSGLIGEPVVRAVDYEASLSLPLVLLPAKEVIEEEEPGKIGWVSDMSDIELKEGQLIHGLLIFPRPIESLIDLARKNYELFRIWGPYDIAKAWYQVLAEVQAVIQRRRKRNG